MRLTQVAILYLVLYREMMYADSIVNTAYTIVQMANTISVSPYTVCIYRSMINGLVYIYTLYLS